MRYHLLGLLALGLTVTTATAQTERGNVLLGVAAGDISFAHGREQGSSFSAALFPTAAYFLADNLALGGTLHLGYDNRPAANYLVDYRGYSFSYGFSPLARYYVLGTGKHQVFAEAGVDLQWERVRVVARRPVQGEPPQYSTFTNRYHGYHGAIGYNYFVAPTVALEAWAGYLRHIRTVTASPNSFDVHLGFSVFLPAKAN